MANFTGTAGDDDLHGTKANDTFHLEDGGADTVFGGHGYDLFYLGGTLGEGDRINGGVGGDIVFLDGDYSAGLVVSEAQLISIEQVSLGHGHDYDLTLSNDLIDTTDDGAFTVRGDDLRPGDHLRLDASAIDHGSVHLIGGAGADLLIGASVGTGFDLGAGGADTALGGAGDDFFGFGRRYSADDHVDGGGGRDEISFSGGSGPIVLDGDAIRSVEVVDVLADSISLVVEDAFLKPGRTLLVDSAYKAEAFSFDGSAETDGRFELHGSRWGDHLTGGAMGDEISGSSGGDTLLGGGGGDTLSGGFGHDWFVYASVNDSKVDAADTIVDFEDGDFIDLSAIDADTTLAGDQQFERVHAFTHQAGQLVLAEGDGVIQLLADVDGDGVADLQVNLQGPLAVHGHFVL